jgi:hypothetical protein
MLTEDIFGRSEYRQQNRENFAPEFQRNSTTHGFEPLRFKIVA